MAAPIRAPFLPPINPPMPAPAPLLPPMIIAVLPHERPFFTRCGGEATALTRGQRHGRCPRHGPFHVVAINRLARRPAAHRRAADKSRRAFRA